MAKNQDTPQAEATSKAPAPQPGDVLFDNSEGDIYDLIDAIDGKTIVTPVLGGEQRIPRTRVYNLYRAGKVNFRVVQGDSTRSVTVVTS